MRNNPTTSFGFMLRLQTESTYRCMLFASSDHSDSTRRPSLVITYALPYTNYYSKSSGSLDSLGTWGTNADGTGTAPGSFSADNAIYNIVNNSVGNINGTSWIVTGQNTGIVIGDGSNTYSISVPASKTYGSDSLYVRNNVTLTFQGTVLTNKLVFETGSTAQYITNNAQTILPALYYNLVLSGGTKSLISNTSVKNVLAMLSSINCNNYILTLGTGTSQTGSLAYSSGSIVGQFARWFAPAVNTGSGSGLFPLGTASQYTPVLIEYTTAPSNGGVLTGAFIPTNPGNSGLPLIDFTISPIVNVNKAAPNGYWDLTSSGISGGNYTATITANGFSGISNISGLRLLRRSNSSSSWSLTGSAVAPTGSAASPVVARSGISTPAGNFTIGADSTSNPLPVEWISFSATEIDGHTILLTWQTANELNNDYFTVQYSTNNLNWTDRSVIKGAGTSANIHEYQFKDDFPGYPSGIYYRIQQTDFNGNTSLSNTAFINKNKFSEKISIFPNPATSEITINTTGTKSIVIINDLGQIVYSGTTNKINIEDWKRGIYLIVVETEEHVYNTHKLFVR